MEAEEAAAVAEGAEVEEEDVAEEVVVRLLSFKGGKME